MMDEQSSNNSPDNSIHHLSNSRDTSSTSKPNQVGTVILYGVPIVSLVIESQERLCLAQISNTLLKQFSYNEIHNRRVALGITCVQCTPVQLEILRRAGAMPVSSRRCGMITRREAERLCKSFLGDNAPPRLPDDFAFSVHHECAWGCRGSFLPSRYNSSRAKCIKCTLCGLFFSPNKFIFHSHRMTPSDKYVQPDAANFNSWRRHMKLSGSPPEEIVFAWEDVKAMFNGGTRKRLLTNTIVPMRSSKQPKLSESNVVAAAAAVAAVANRPIVPAPRLPTVCQDHAIATLPHISRVAMDFIYNKPFSLSASYASFPWLKRNPLLFPSAHHHDHGNGGSTAAAAAAGFFGGGPLNQTHKTQHSVHNNDGPHSSYHHHQSAFKPVQSIGTMEVHDGIDIDGDTDPEAGVISPAIVSTLADDISRSGVTPNKAEQSDEEDEDDVDIETTDEKLDTDIEDGAARANAAGPSQWSPKQEATAVAVLANVQTSEIHSESPVVQSLPVLEHAQSQSFLARTQAHGLAQMPVPTMTPEVLPSLTHRIWNISKLSFEGTNRANFLYRQNLHRHLFLGGDSSLMSTSAAISEIGTKLTSSLDCSTCMTQQNTHFTENINKID